MSINAKDLKDYVIVPALQKISLYCLSSVNLGLGTSATESNLGTYLAQHNNGPARGIYQMEEATFNDILNNFLNFKPELKSKIMYVTNSAVFPSFERITYDLMFATIMMRIHYLRAPEKLPDANDVAALARYWKKYYNTPLGKGEVIEFINKYNKYVLNK